MIPRRLLFLLPLMVLAAPARAAPATQRVLLETALGRIVIEVDLRHAPITAGNFLRYVDAHKFDGKAFYRAARDSGAGTTGLVQGGIDDRVRDSFFPIAHEPTTKTGLHHGDGTLSMARNKPGTAMGDFFICVGDAKRLDATANYAGYAAFGHVVSGMDVVRRILAQPTFPGGYSMDMLGQTIRKRVTIISARRIG